MHEIAEEEIEESYQNSIKLSVNFGIEESPANSLNLNRWVAAWHVGIVSQDVHIMPKFYR